VSPEEDDMRTIDRAARVAAPLIALACAACGGGGDSTPLAPAPTSPIAGAWQGTTSTGFGTETLILEDGSLWSIGGVVNQSGLFPDSLMQGRWQAANGALTSDDLRAFDFAAATATGATASGSYSATAIDATITPSGGAAYTLQLTPVARASYDYDHAAALTDVEGNWTGFYSFADSGSLAIAADGTFTATTALGCQLSGRLTPRASGKNVFDASLAFGPAPCIAPNTHTSGIAYVASGGGVVQLTIAAVDAPRDFGAAFFGER
jgi:hypothetical protein